MTDQPAIGSLFAGIGGFDLGLERVGFGVAWQVEKDEDCNEILRRHWPNVQRWENVKDVSGEELEPVSLVCGGFPCQDVSKARIHKAGKGEGLAGSRSNLFFEFIRIVDER